MTKVRITITDRDYFGQWESQETHWVAVTGENDKTLFLAAGHGMSDAVSLIHNRVEIEAL